MKRQSVHFLWNEPQITDRFSSAVSLHSHTDRSREGLSSIPRYAQENALIGLAVARISSAYKKFAGRNLDFQTAGGTRPIPTPPNTLVLLEGAVVRHTVTPLGAGERRIILSMTFCADPTTRPLLDLQRRFKDIAYVGIRALWT